MREIASGIRVAAPAQLHLDVLRLPLTARAVVLRDELVVGVRRDEAIAGARRELGRLRATRRDVDRRGRLAERVQASVRHGEVASTEAALATAEQRAHQVDRLFEHLATDLERWPAPPDDVLVQVLAGADAEEEAPVEHDVRGRRGLRDDRGMHADDRTGDPGPDGELRRRRDPTDDRPDERALTLPVDPRMEVIGELHVRKTHRLGALRRADDLVRAVLLTRDPKADLHSLARCSERAATRVVDDSMRLALMPGMAKKWAKKRAPSLDPDPKGGSQVADAGKPGAKRRGLPGGAGSQSGSTGVQGRSSPR